MAGMGLESLEFSAPTVSLPVLSNRKDSSLLSLLIAEFQRAWNDEANSLETEEDVQPLLALAVYRSGRHLRKRTPDEIERVLAMMDQEAFTTLQRSFGKKSFDMQQFVQAVLHSGSYDPNRALAYVGGVIDLFLEVFRSQADRADMRSGSTVAVNWGQLMNHIIETPELSMFKGTTTFGPTEGNEKTQSNPIEMNGFVDAAQHPGNTIEKIYWYPNLDVLTALEGTDSIYFWSPHVSWDTPKTLTPDMGPEDYGPMRPPPFTVLSVAWDLESQELSALLSNRMIVQFKLRNREKVQFQQKRSLTFNCFRGKAKMDASAREALPWWLSLMLVGYKAPGEGHPKKVNYSEEPARLKKDLQVEQQTAETCVMEEIFYHASTKSWFTSHADGRLFLWNLRTFDKAIETPELMPTTVLTGHRRSVTCYVEISMAKFATCSLDCTVIVWDSRSLTSDVILKDHTGCVLSLCYMPLFNTMISVACETRVLVWSMDATGFRGCRAKLTGHSANLQRTAASQQVFFSMDEAAGVLVWDAATLVCLQSFKSSFMKPNHMLCLSSLGRLCLAAKRLTFYEGDDDLAVSMGKAPSKQQLAIAKKNKKSANFKQSATPRWCGVAESRGSVVSATEAEVRLHTRSAPDQSKVLFNAPEGDTIAVFEASDKLSIAVVGTSKGAIHFMKYRSGFALQSYPGRREDAAKPGAAAAQTPAAKGDNANANANANANTNANAKGSNASAAVSLPAAAIARSSSKGDSSAAGSVHGSPPGSAAKDRFDRSMDGTPAASSSAAASSTPASPSAAKAPAAQSAAVRENPSPTARSRRASENKTGSYQPYVAPQNAPSAQDIQKGLSTHIQCVKICEDQKRIYIGTAEGQVLVFSCEPSFPAIWWLSHPFDTSGVACLTCESKTGPGGILAVGTQDGLAHLYNLDSLRLAGSISIPNALPDFDNTRTVALSHVRVLSVSKHTGLPLTLVTIDAQSRFRFWGFQMDSNSGLVTDLKLLLDGSQLPMPKVDIGSEGEGSSFGSPCPSARAEAAAGGRLSRPSSAGRRYSDGDGSSMFGDGSDGDAEGRMGSRGKSGSSAVVAQDNGGVCITAVTAIDGQFLPPIHASAKQPPEGPRPAAVVKGEEDAKMAEEAAQREAAARKAAEEAALAALAPKQSLRRKAAASQSAGSLPVSGPGATEAAVPKNQQGAHPPADSRRSCGSAGNTYGSDSEGDDDDTVEARLRFRPTSPKRRRSKADLSLAEPTPPPSLSDGADYLFLADSAGRIWCLDMVATLAKANSSADARTVPFKLDSEFTKTPPPSKDPPASGFAQTTNLRGSPSRRGSIPGGGFQMMGRKASIGGAPMSSGEGDAVAPRPSGMRRGSTGPGAARGVGTSSGTGGRDAMRKASVASLASIASLQVGPFAPKACGPPPPLLKPNPGALCLVGGRPWRAHTAPIVSLVAVGSPPVLVSADAVREVKVWSTAGDLWGHFSLGGANAVSPSVAVWPPPQGLAVQGALMKVAKRMCKRLGLHGSQQEAERSRLGSRQGSKERKGSKPRRGSFSASTPARLGSASSALSATKGRVQFESATPSAASASSTVRLPAVSDASTVRLSAVGEAARGGPAKKDEECGEASPAESSRQEELDSEAPKNMFTPDQITNMVRNHGFSRGCESYREFKKMPKSASMSFLQQDAFKKMEDMRAEFMARPGSGLGVSKLENQKMEEEVNVGKVLGRRAASESTLLRYVQSATQELSRGVYEELGIDVTRTKKRDLRKASFIASLDVNQVSFDSSDPTSATAEAAKRVLARSKRKSRKKD